MAIRLKKIFTLCLFFGFVHCAEFQGIFDAIPQSSREIPQKISKKKTDVESQKAVVLASEDEIKTREPITTKQGVYYFVKEGDTLAKISENFKIDWEAIAQVNHLSENQLVVGRRLFIPHRKNLEKFGVILKTRKKEKHKENISEKAGKIDFLWPVEGGHITSGFGMRRGRPHDAIDIATKVGTPVFAAESGEVIFSKRFAGYGNLIVIKHRNDYFTAYAHNQKIYASSGQRVKRGQKIALVGRSGRATGPHLHFEIRHKTKAVNPLQFFSNKK